jgi:SPP1 gp7 family putative phage head morphogenesis protein
VRGYIAGDLAVQKQLGIKTSFNLVKSAATEYGKEYKRLLVDRGGGMIVDKEGKLVFKDWFAQSSKANREAVADIINTGIKEGKGVRETEKDLKQFFNQRKRHAELVARTETAKAQSIATTNRLIEQGIENVQWITAEDERVRHSHALRHNKIYPTGSIFVGEPNCRCDIVGFEEEV